MEYSSEQEKLIEGTGESGEDDGWLDTHHYQVIQSMSCKIRKSYDIYIFLKNIFQEKTAEKLVQEMSLGDEEEKKEATASKQVIM